MPKASRNATATSARDRIIDYLSENGGRIESPDGLGLTASMAAATGYNQVAALNAMLVRLESEGLIRREVRGKRTLSISLSKRRGGGKAAASPRKSAARATSTRGARATTAAKKSTRGRSASSDVSAQLAELRKDADSLASRIAALQKALA